MFFIRKQNIFTAGNLERTKKMKTNHPGFSEPFQAFSCLPLAVQTAL